MKAEKAWVGARAVDSYPYSIGGKQAQADALKLTGVDCFIGYLGCMNKERLGYILDAGLAFMPVTVAGEYNDGADDEIAQLTALGIPKGVTVWLDLEGLAAWNSDRALLARKINTWADAIKVAGWMPGLYVGAPMPFTGKELYALHVVRYWLGIGRAVSKATATEPSRDAYPDCGWCMRQDWHGQKSGMFWKNTGVLVDTNGIQCDHQGRVPVWVVG